MRRLALIALLLSVLVAVKADLFGNNEFGDDDETRRVIKKVLSTWKKDKKVTIIDDHDVDDANAKHRAKARYLPLEDEWQPPGERAACSLPGYTGALCEFPICNVTNNNVPNVPANTEFGAAIDMNYQIPCNAQYTTHIDSALGLIMIEIQTNGVTNPSITLYNEQGISVSPNDVVSGQTVYRAFYTYLPPGPYIIQPASSNPNVECIILVNGRTNMTMSTGWVSLVDFGQPERYDFPSPFAVQGMANTFVTHVNHLRWPGQLSQVSLFQDVNIISRHQMSSRYGCGYEQYFQSFFCITTGDYFYLAEGYDFYGYSFRRVNYFQCIVSPSATPGTPTTPTTPAGGLICRNDGILLNATDGSQYCYCQPLFTGVDCGAILCFNGGTPSASGLFCFCPSGFLGPHCQNVTCDPLANHGFGVDRPRLTFVIRSRYTMTDLIQPIIDNIQRLVTEYSFDPAYLSNFGLVLFNNNQVSLIQSYSALSDMIADLRNVQLNPDTNGGCTDSVLAALTSALGGVALSNKSPVYVFTDALANDGQLEEGIHQRNTFWRASIYFIYVTPSINSGCVPDPFDAGYRVFNRIAIRSAGHVFDVPDRTKTGELFYAHALNTLYRMNYVLMNDPAQCVNQPQFQPVMVDTQLAQLVVTATGNQLSLSVMDPDGRQVTPNVAYTLNFTYIWTIPNPHAGQWFFTIQSGTPTSACSYRVLAINYLNSRTDYDFFWATTPILTLDGIGYQPVYQVATPLVGHINNYRLNDLTKVFAETTIYANDELGNRQAVYFSNGIWRDGCNYQLYFGPFTCQRPNQVLYMTVFVRDSVGFMIQRSSMMYCAGAHPTFFPPSTCQNGGVQVTDPNTNTTFCLCQPYYNGDLCQNSVCINGGSDIGGACYCPPGHSGIHCEITRCISSGNETRFGPNEKQIAFVIEMTRQSVAGLFYLNQYISTLIRDFQSQHPRWLTTFIVTGYNSTYSAILKSVTADHAYSVVDAINEAYNWTVTNMDPSCTVQLWQALDMTMAQLGKDALVFVFQASIPEQGTLPILMNVVNVYDAIYGRQIQMNVFLGLAQGVYPCNSNITAFALLFEATALSNGLVYETQLANWNGIIRIMPNYYESGIVYEDFYYDCASQPRNFYVPIDSVTQTMQVTTFGLRMNQTILQPNGTVYPDSYDLVSDSITGLHITEVRRACDQGWEPFGQYCLYFFLTPTLTWFEAQAFCAAGGGFLIDDLSAEKDFFLQQQSGNTNFWLGLNRNGGSFAWDRPNGTQQTPLGNTFVNWAPGYPVADPTANCVSNKHIPIGSAGLWYNENCTMRYSFACEKHKYNQNVTAGFIGDNDLQPGIWQVQMQTAPAQGQFSGCFVQIRTQSRIQIYHGYTQDRFSDVPDIEPLKGSMNNHFMVATTGLDGQNPGYLQYAHIYGRNLTLQRSATYERRNNCNFPFLSQRWSCPGDGPSAFQAMHVGVDQQGYRFQRIVGGQCINGPTGCSNGGAAYQGVCYCTAYWTGQTCTIPVCINGGVLTANNRTCICPTGYSGHACQFPQCTPQIPQDFGFDGKSLVIAVEITLQNSATLNRLRDFIPGWLTGITNQQPNWFSNFILVTFNSTNANAPIVTTTVNDFSAAFNASTSTITDFSGTCPRPLFTALAAALNTPQLVTPGSVVWVISKGSPSDPTQETAAFLAIASTRALVNFIVVDDSFRPCGNDPNSDVVSPMIDTAVASGGNAFFLSTPTFTTHLTVYMPTLYQSSLLDVSFNRTCPAGSRWYAQVDYQMTQVVIDTYAFYAQISVTDPQGNPVVTSDLYNSPLNRLVVFNTVGSNAGIYTIAVSTQAPTCIVQVRGSSPLQLFIGYTQATSGNGQSQDDSYYSPVANVNTNLVLAHMNGLAASRIGGLRYVEMVSNRGRVISTMMPRFNCSYEYYSDTFQCPDTAFLVVVHGTDDTGLNFRRFVIAFCVTSRPTTSAQPATTGSTALTTSMAATTTGTTSSGAATTSSGAATTTPMATTTLNTGTTPSLPPTSSGASNMQINLDLVIAIDASATMPTANFLDVVNFLRSTLIPYTIGQGDPGTRVAIITVPGANNFLLPAQTLQSIASRQALLDALNSLNQTFYDGSAGQQFNTLLAEAISQDFMRAGYRNAISNHLLLYITGTSTFTDTGDPVATANSIRTAKTYGIITIAYTTQTVDTNLLTNISGGADCFRQYTTVDQLNRQGTPFLLAMTLNGQYCGMT